MWYPSPKITLSKKFLNKFYNYFKFHNNFIFKRTWNFIDENEISLYTKDLILHIVQLTRIGYMIKLTIAWKKRRNMYLFLRHAMWKELLSNKISTSCVWLCCTSVYDFTQKVHNSHFVFCEVVILVYCQGLSLKILWGRVKFAGTFCLHYFVPFCTIHSVTGVQI